VGQPLVGRCAEARCCGSLRSPEQALTMNQETHSSAALRAATLARLCRAGQYVVAKLAGTELDLVEPADVPETNADRVGDVAAPAAVHRAPGAEEAIASARSHRWMRAPRRTHHSRNTRLP
jgi:hypothetical protein